MSTALTPSPPEGERVAVKGEISMAPSIASHYSTVLTRHNSGNSSTSSMRLR
jgi:hypothetical protein